VSDNNGFRVIVTGGRDYDVPRSVYAVLDAVLLKRPSLHIIHGGAFGADELAGEWARARGVPCTVFEAEWDKYGKGAGHIRNQAMLDAGAQGGVAFPGGTGTADMTTKMKRAGIPVWEIPWGEEWTAPPK
jgi:hypothetical protein